MKCPSPRNNPRSAPPVATPGMLLNEKMDKETTEPEIPECGIEAETQFRKRTEELFTINARLFAEINEREQIQRAIFDSICDPAWMKSKEGVYRAANRAWCRFFGRVEAEVIGKRDTEVFSEEIVREFHKRDIFVINTGKPTRHEESITSDRGTSWFDTVITPVFDEQHQIIGTVGIARDITERKFMEDKLLQTQRMESIGSLAGGIAHDLNNILGPIMMSASILREEMPKETRDEIIGSILESAKRGADIVRQVLTFARGVKGEMKVLEPLDLISHLKVILKETLPKSIDLSTSLPDDLWNITGDLTQLQQVLMNLCVNARDAMPMGGTLTLKAENCAISQYAADKISGAKPGLYVKIKVADSGLGISQEIIDQIYDPFFTTKEAGKGTGLGLSTVMGIVKNHGGFIAVESKIGKGTKFSVYIPATNQSHTPVAKEHLCPSRQGDGELVLVVDDELSICKMVETILRKRGYKALIARGGKDALALYAKHRTEIKAVLTDLAMPCMDGVVFTRKLREIDPAITVIASTGQSTEHWRKELGELGVSLFLAKPYTADQLLEVVCSAVCNTDCSA